MIVFRPAYAVYPKTEVGYNKNIGLTEFVMPEYNPTIREKWVLNGSLVKISGIKLEKDNINLNADETAEIKAEVQPYNASDKVVIWTSSNPLVASVDRYGVGTLNFRIGANSGGSSIEVHLGSPDGKLIGKLNVAGTGGWQKWEIQSCEIEKTSGINDVYLIFKGGSGYLFNVNWWSLEYNEKGDCNSDGSINIADLVALQKWVFGNDTL